VGPRKVFASARDRRTVLIVTAAAVIIFMLLAWAVGRIPILTDPKALRRWLLGFGVFAPLIFILLQAAQVVVAPIPGQVLGVASGYLFGTLWGTVYSLVGATLGTWIALRLARRFGRPFVERVLAAELIDRFDRIAEERGLLAMFLVFLVPGLPDDVICFVAGVTELRIRNLLVASLIGRLPGYLLANAAGDSLAATRYVEAGVILAVLGIAAGIGYLYRERVLTALESG
jgi:uncharacterized membrane protein YdjX (TVP38/TMEM64 family)